MLTSQIIPAIERMQKELSINGGGSLKDAVIHTRDTVGILNSRSLFTIDRSNLGLFECNTSGDCVFANSAMASLFGTSPESLKGKGWLQFIDESERFDVWDSWKRMLSEGVPYDSTFKVINPSTFEATLCHSVAQPHYGVGGKILGYVGIVEKLKHAA